MGAQKGRDLLVRVSNGADGFVAVAGLRARQLAFNAETVDVTNADSAGRWRELLAGAGCAAPRLRAPACSATRPPTRACARRSSTA
ncbi:hypothetical protein GCM10025880_43740 [Methylorubrum aminovorans]|nr:hypothetical protein GCM10025880_43740 [Methylorubrum aminovorans]